MLAYNAHTVAISYRRLCPVFLTNLEGKVGKVGKEGRLLEKQLPILYHILQQSNKNGEKINEQFCCGNLEKSLILDTDI